MAEKKAPKQDDEAQDKPETPSAIADAKVGQPPEGASDVELVAHAEKWQAEKRRAHRGF